MDLMGQWCSGKGLDICYPRNWYFHFPRLRKNNNTIQELIQQSTSVDATDIHWQVVFTECQIPLTLQLVYIDKQHIVGAQQESIYLISDMKS